MIAQLPPPDDTFVSRDVARASSAATSADGLIGWNIQSVVAGVDDLFLPAHDLNATQDRRGISSRRPSVIDPFWNDLPFLSPWVEGEFGQIPTTVGAELPLFAVGQL